MSRLETHPIVFAAGEAVADRATCAVVVWETSEGFAWRAYPHASLAVLIGLHDVIGTIIDQARDAANGGADDDDGTD